MNLLPLAATCYTCVFGVYSIRDTCFAITAALTGFHICAWLYGNITFIHYLLSKSDLVPFSLLFPILSNTPCAHKQLCCQGMFFCALIINVL